jgi:tetratricopeptide (TPR) repeat protein
MPTRFDLVITADSPSRTAELSLRDASGVQIGYRKTELGKISVSHQRGLFDLRNYLRLYVEEGKEQAALAKIGVCIAEEVLGEEIFAKLWASQSPRTLRIQLPGAGDTDNHLAAALARVPWEIARPTADDQTLGERNLLVRVVHDMQPPASTPIELAAGEALRVLFVFAESRGSQPLGARQERRELLRLFDKEVYPSRRVVAHFLTHGVTRQRLVAQIQENGGYHVVHWSGHGHRNLLELCKPGGAKDLLSGTELLELFHDAGGFLPQLFFLSACHSGDILRVKDWADFFAVAQGKQPGKNDTDTKKLDLEEQPGFTGTAHALLQGGVPSVVAMRYAVGDDYARETAIEFYRALLAHAQPKNVATALTLARQAMLNEDKHDQARFSVSDHATPVLYGEEQPGLTLAGGRSPSLNPRNPRLHTIAELSVETSHKHFVGRTWELAGLGSEFIGSSTGEEVKPVALVTGLGGMGKTALAAEALALWQSRFEWVLLYQAKPSRLELEGTLRDIHLKLMGELKRYHDYVKENPADAIYRDASAGFTGPERLGRLTSNLVRALKDEPILLVLDNFEGNLKPADPETQLAVCQDPAWDDCLARLATELAGSPSRVLMTCRRPLAALANGAAHVVPLGPLPKAEAALYVREHPTLSRMFFGADEDEQKLAERILAASRFHPLLMDRLAKLAAGTALRPQLLAALEALENTKDFTQLPALFAATPGDAKELAYLEDALASSLDRLIRGATPDARLLLWIIALANQPERLGLVRKVWSGESHEQEQLRQLRKMLEMLPPLPLEMQAELQAMPPEIRAMLEALPPAGPVRPELAPLLAQLVSVGLVEEQRDEPDHPNPNLTCHELVRERIRAWMESHPEDRGELAENAIRLAYAERLEATFKGLRHRDMTAAFGAGSRALVYCVQAEAWERLGSFASGVVGSARDPRLLEALVPHLQMAADSAPEGQLRWRCLGNLADALRSAGRPDASLPFYERAAAQASAAAEAGGGGSRRAWADLAAITGNWALALRDVGNLDAARQRQLESADAERKAGNPEINVIGSELEALRIDIMQGQVESALPEVESRLALVESWWQRQRSGETVPEAPDTEFLGLVLIGALDIARQAHFAQEDWPAALRRIEAILEVKGALGRPEEDIAGDRMNRANVLGRLRRFGEARAEMEECLEVFRNDPAASSKVLSSLADVLDEQGDVAQAIIQERRALALCEQLPDPRDRAISHDNLATYLERRGAPPDRAQSPHHRLAALLYCLVAGFGQSLQTSLRNFADDFGRARATGTELAIPRVAELLANPAFAPLEQWLRHRQVNVADLQAEVDEFLDEARQAAPATPGSSSPNQP